MDFGFLARIPPQSRQSGQGRDNPLYYALSLKLPREIKNRIVKTVWEYTPSGALDYKIPCENENEPKGMLAYAFLVGGAEKEVLIKMACKASNTDLLSELKEVTSKWSESFAEKGYTKEDVARIHEAASNRLYHETPKKGADNKLVVFLHPKTTNGVLIELCQEIRS